MLSEFSSHNNVTALPHRNSWFSNTFDEIQLDGTFTEQDFQGVLQEPNSIRFVKLGGAV